MKVLRMAITLDGDWISIHNFQLTFIYATSKVKIAGKIKYPVEISSYQSLHTLFVFESSLSYARSNLVPRAIEIKRLRDWSEEKLQ
jgi:hypothetical protein